MNDSGYQYSPIPPAKEFHDSLADIRLLVCGARSGKTRSTLGGELIRDALFQPGFMQRDVDDGENYGILVCEPTFKMAKLIAWALIIKALPQNRIIHIDRQDWIIHFQGIWGITQIIFSSYEQGASKIEGIRLYRAYLDECFQCPENYYDEVITRLSDSLGRLVMVGTPKPVAWIIDRIINKASVDNSIFYKSWKTSENPYFKKERLESLRKLLPPKIFKRNFEACLDGFQGQVYEEFDRNLHPQDFQIDIEKYRFIWGSMDWGWTHNGSLYIFGLRDDDNVDILHEVSEPGLTIVPVPGSNKSWAEIMRDYQAMYSEKFDYFYAGPDRPENIESISSLGVRIQAADNPVVEGIQFVSALLHVYENEHGEKASKIRIHKTNCPKICQRMPMLRWQERADGTFDEKQFKKDDDECDSVRYGLFSMRKWFNLYAYFKESKEVS